MNNWLPVGCREAGQEAAIVELCREYGISTETGREALRAFLKRMDRCYRETAEDLVVLEQHPRRRRVPHPR